MILPQNTKFHIFLACYRNGYRDRATHLYITLSHTFGTKMPLKSTATTLTVVIKILVSLNVTNTPPWPFKSQGWPTLHQFYPTKINIQSKDRSRELFNDHQRETALIFRQILATNSVSKMSEDQCREFVCGSLDILIFKVENLPRGLNIRWNIPSCG